MKLFNALAFITTVVGVFVYGYRAGRGPVSDPIPYAHCGCIGGVQ